MADYYETLGVARSASADDIKAAFRKLAKEHHPDKHGGSDEAKARFQQINEAYQTLSDATKREQYDMGPSAGMGGGFGPGGFHHAGGPDIDFEEILRHAMRSGRGGPPPRNRDYNVTYQITLEEAFAGKEAELNIKVNSEQKKIKVKVPPGIDNGIRIRYVGQGNHDDSNLPPGDLYVHVQVGRHYQFMRHGPHLETSIAIDYVDAMLGADVEVPIIEGGSIKLSVPAGIVPGQSLRAVGKGMPVGNGGRGDLFIEVVIQAPTLNDEQKDLLQKVKSLRAS